MWVEDCRHAEKYAVIVAFAVLAAPDIYFGARLKEGNPDRALSFTITTRLAYGCSPGSRGDVSQTNIAVVGEQGCARRSFTFVLQRTPLFFHERRLSFSVELQRQASWCTADGGVLGEYYSSPVAADHKVYIAIREGVVVVLDAGEELKNTG